MISKALVVLVSIAGGAVASGLDVDSVRFEGDATLCGMRIEQVSSFAGGGFRVETTGACFRYVRGGLEIYQGLERNSQRLLAKIQIGGRPKLELVEHNTDRVLFHSDELNVGIYGDSTCIMDPKSKVDIECLGNFEPDYKGQHKGELLLIDELGGTEIYPQRDETGYKTGRLSLDGKRWRADYELQAGQRVMMAAFPGKKFDWAKSFRTNAVMTCGSVGLGENNPYGQMPSDFALKRWAQNFHIVVMFFSGLYEPSGPGGQPHPAGPYAVANEEEFKRLLQTSHEAGLKVAAYCSLFYYAKKHKDFAGFYKQIESLRDKFGIDGVYIDGLTFDDRIANWEMVRRLRQLFGADGVIIYHGTHLGSPVATTPNIDSYCDATVNGEGVAFDSVSYDYIQYQVRKYGISNTVAMWKRGGHPASISEKDIVDAIIAMNGRDRWGGFVTTTKVPPGNKYVWPVIPDETYLYYLEQLEKLKAAYYGTTAEPSRN